MNLLLLYILQSTVTLTIFYILYELLFKHDAYFVFNRFYLLVAILVSTLLPMFDFSVQDLFATTTNAFVVAPVYSFVEYTLNEVVIYGDATINQSTSWFSNISLFHSLLIMYIGGVIISFLIFIFRLIQLSHLFLSSELENTNGIKFVYTKQKTPVFSFFNHIFIDKKTLRNTNEIEKIIDHEMVHIKQKHSIDLIFAELITIIQWFNPMAYMLRNSLKENHEFIADKDVIISYPDTMAYSRLLIDNSSIVKTNILTHNFSYSLLKRRLFMIKKTKSPLRFSAKVVVASLAMSLVFFACSGPGQKDEIDLATTDKDIPVIEFPEVFTVVETMPEFPGGSEEMIKYLGNNLKYPKEAKDKGVQGKVYVNFVIEKEGIVSNVKVVKGVGYGCDKEAIRVVEAMPKWTPGIQKGKNVRVSYNLPIKFVLSETVSDSIYTLAKVMPEFPGGTKKLLSFLSKNIKYPEKAKKAGVQGRVFVSFVVEVDGSVSGVKLLRGIGSGCDEEAMRVVRSMPNWKPGMNDGNPVRVQYNLPIKYALQ